MAQNRSSAVTAAVQLECGDCLEIMPRLIDEGPRADSAVFDPPYHLASIVERLGSPDAAPIQSGATGVYARSSAGFMGQKWDGGDVAFRVGTWRLIHALLKPGAHVLAFGHVRTWHRMACAAEDAGFEVRNMLDWLYGTGFPKSHNLDGEWQGWGTDLKPAKEPILLARKPMIGSVAENMAAFGTGALNIDGCRVPGAKPDTTRGAGGKHGRYGPIGAQGRIVDDGRGRWPANVVHDGSDEVREAFAAYGERGAAAPVRRRSSNKFRNTYGAFKGNADEGAASFHGDRGSAARFFYSAKAVDGERVYRCAACGAHQLGKPGCGHEELESHPTVKPVALMRWLVRMITPPGGLVIDPFAGTGTTGAAAIAEGMSALLIEQDADYQADIRVRLGAALSARVHARPVRQLAAGPLFGEAAA